MAKFNDRFTRTRDKILNDLADNHERRLFETLEQLEQKVVNAVNELHKRQGKLFDTRLAIEIRPKLKQFIEETFSKTIDTNIREYDRAVSTILGIYGELPIPKKFKFLTDINKEVIANLKKQTFQGFQSLANEYLDDLANEVYQSTIVGKPFNEIVRDLKQKINGIYASTDNEKAEELTNFIKENKFKASMNSKVDEAISELQKIYLNQRTGDNFSRYTRQMAHDSLMQFDANFNMEKAREVGLTHFEYSGNIIRDSRDWCISHVGRIMTEDEIREEWENNSWAGKSSGDPFIVRGGYNCRHHWVATDPDWLNE